MPISRKAHSALNFSGLRAVNSRVAACRAAIGSHRPARWPSDHAPSATCPSGMPRMEPLEPALRLLTTTEATSWIEKPTQRGKRLPLVWLQFGICPFGRRRGRYDCQAKLRALPEDQV